MTAIGKRKELLVLMSGSILALAMPGFPLGLLVFVALVPLFFALDGRHGFLPGYLTGVVFFGLDLRWGVTLLRFNALALPGMIVLVGYLAVYFGIFGWITRLVQQRYGEAWAVLVVAPTVYAGLEILRAGGPLGTTFSDLYLGLYRFPALIQWASVIGPWGLTAAIVFVNGAIYLSIRQHRWRFIGVAAVMIGVLAAGNMIPVSPGTPEIKVAIVSSAVPQKEKLNERNLMPLVQMYMALGQQAAASHPGLIVFPESILPGYILRDTALRERFVTLTRDAGCPILFGTGDLRAGKIYNSVVLMSPQGKISGEYDMVHPVPFGEYIPGRKLIDRVGLGRFAASFLPVDLARGTAFTPIDGIGTPICFESTFPGPARAFVKNGASLLVTVTNDAWFAGSSELAAHFAFAVFRAVENRRYVVQAANGGISGAVDPRGRIIAAQSGPGVIVTSVSWERGRSPYTVHGEQPLYACFGVIGLMMLGKLGWDRWGRSDSSRPTCHP